MIIRTGRTRRALGGIVVACAAALFTMAPASAGSPNMNASPTSLHAGEAVSVFGNCSGTDVKFTLYAGWVNNWSIPDSDAVKVGSLPVGKGIDINWSGEVVIPVGTAPGVYTLRALCDSSEVAYNYHNIELAVMADQATGSTTTVALASTTTVAPATKPAAPVTAKPTYTG